MKLVSFESRDKHFLGQKYSHNLHFKIILFQEDLEYPNLLKQIKLKELEIKY